MKMMKPILRIGTRGSALAKWQANHVKELILSNSPDLKATVEIIKTTGDKNISSNLAEFGGKGVFVKEIEEALLSNTIDIAVHSMKDMPTQIPDGLCIGGVIERHDPRDVLISNGNYMINELRKGAILGTGSLRRKSQILREYPHLKVSSIRGNVDTRVKKLKSGEYDCIVVAKAGIDRMGMSEVITEILGVDVMIPAPCQGIICIESRVEDKELLDVLDGISHGDTAIEAFIERDFLRHISGDCNVPAGCYSNLDKNGSIKVVAFIASEDGKNYISEEISGLRDDFRTLGSKLADTILKNGGSRVLEEINKN